MYARYLACQQSVYYVLETDTEGATSADEPAVMTLAVTSSAAWETKEAVADVAALVAFVTAGTTLLASLFAEEPTDEIAFPAAEVADDTALLMDEVTDGRTLPAADVADAIALPVEEVAGGTIPAAEYAADIMGFDWLLDKAPSSCPRSRPRMSRLYLTWKTSALANCGRTSV